MGEFYENHPYPPPVDDLQAYRARCNNAHRHAESALLWPAEPYRDDRSVLVAGCGTSQAARYAVRWPNARIVGIDVNAAGIAFTQELKHRHALENLTLHQLPIERAGELGQRFDYVVSTGVIHHLADPGVGLRTLRAMLTPKGALHLMVYAPYGRAGIYMLQEYCRRLGIGWSDAEIETLAETLKGLPSDHPLVPLLQRSRDFSTHAGIADALLHPQDRAYSVPQVFDLLENAGLQFGRWLRQAPYLASCGIVAGSPHRPRLAQLPPREQYAAIELFRGTMTRHSVVAYRDDLAPEHFSVRFHDDRWLDYVPIRPPDAVIVRESLPPGVAAVLINRSHAFADLFLPITAREERLLEAIDGRRRIRDIGRATADVPAAREFFEKLWQWDQAVFATGS